MGIRKNSFNRFLNHTRGTGATRISPTTGFIVGVDFSTTSNTIGTGSKTFTLTADANVNREWTVGENVLVTSQAGATGTMTGTVTSYTPSTQALVINVPVGGTTGSGTSTDWRIGSLEVRRDANGLVVETAATNSFAGSNSASVIGGSATLFAASPEGINNAPIFVPNTSTTSHRLDRSGVPNSAVFLSVYLKSLGIRHVSLTTNTGANTSFDLELARVNTGPGRIFPLKNGWCLCQITGGAGTVFSVVPTLDSQAVGSTASIGGFDGVQGIAFYGFTLRTDLIGVFTNESHIPTTTVSWTRNADTVTFNSTALQSVRQGQGVIYVDADFPVTTTRTTALSLTGTNSEISLARQVIGTTTSFTKMVESGNTQVFGSSTAGNLFKNLGKQYEAALGTRNDTGATNTNLAIGLASNAVASSGNGFGIAAGNYELTTDSNLSSVTVRGVGGDNLTGSHWTGSRFIIANNSVGQRPVISLDGTSYRVINSPVITQVCNEVTSGLVGGITRVVMVGNGGGIYTSDDQGETWVARTSGVATNFTATTFGNSTFVALNSTAANSRYSTDGITWSAVTGLTGTTTDIIHTGSQFVAINTVGGVFTSTDGITFTAATVSGISPAFTSAQGIAYDNGFYTIVGNGGQIVIAQAAANATSFTFTTFTSAQTLIASDYLEVISFNGQFLAVGGAGAAGFAVRFSQSLTPTFAAAIPLGRISRPFVGLSKNENTVLLSGVSGMLFNTSDLINFSSIAGSSGGAIQTSIDVAFGNSTYVFVGSGIIEGRSHIYTISLDGTVTRRQNPTTSNGISGITFYNGVFYTVNREGASGPGSEHLYSIDNGQTWLSYFTTQSGVNNYGRLTFGNGFAVMLTGLGVRVLSNENVIENFRTQSVSFNLVSAFPNWNHIEFANGIFIIVGNSGIMFTATNPSNVNNWIRRNTNTTQNLTSVMYSTRDNCWYAAGANGTLLRSDDNAVTWYSVNGAMQGYVSSNNLLQTNALSNGNQSGRNKFAVSFANNSVKVSANGNTVVTDTTANIGDITAVTLGENFNGTIRSIRVFPTPKTDSEVTQISLGSIAPSTDDTLAVNSLGDTLQINALGDTLRIN